MRIKIALVVIILGLLAITNPDMDDFKQAARDRLEKELEGKSDVEKAIGKMLGGTATDLLASRTTRTNMILGSLYSFSVDDKEYRYIGIASFFIPLQKELPLENEDMAL
jgi:hypothetical protein